MGSAALDGVYRQLARIERANERHRQAAAKIRETLRRLAGLEISATIIGQLESVLQDIADEQDDHEHHNRLDGIADTIKPLQHRPT